jgi:hypothetical protein
VKQHVYAQGTARSYRGQHVTQGDGARTGTGTSTQGRRQHTYTKGQNYSTSSAHPLQGTIRRLPQGTARRAYFVHTRGRYQYIVHTWARSAISVHRAHPLVEQLPLSYTIRCVKVLAKHDLEKCLSTMFSTPPRCRCRLLDCRTKCRRDPLDDSA